MSLRGLRPTALNRVGENARGWWWSLATSVLLAVLFMEVVFAGAMLSGVAWARSAHVGSAVVLIAATISAGIAALVTLRRVTCGVRLGLTLLALAVAVLVQTATGRLVAGGSNLLWLHVPLGVALVGVAAQALASARRLGGA